MDRLKNAELFLLDMDGTLYLGDDVLPGAIEFVNYLDASGRGYVYLTNNSSRAGADYIPRLRRLGFPCGEGDVFSSGMASALWLRGERPGKTVFVLGTAALRGELESYGVTLSERADIVLAGFDTELTYPKLERAASLLRRGAEFVAANPDMVCPMPGGEALPDCGAICALLTAATGREPMYIGKPNRRMVDIISKQKAVPPERIVSVGDRLYTDMAVAKNAGALSALVLSGETTRDMLARSELRPDYVFGGAADIERALRGA